MYRGRHIKLHFLQKNFFDIKFLINKLDLFLIDQ